MKILKNLSIRKKLILLSVLPSVVMLYFLQSTIFTALAQRQANLRIYENLEVAEHVSELIHQLQRERSMTIAFLMADAQPVSSAIILQREHTDKAAVEMRKIYKRLRRSTIGIDSITNLSTLRNPIRAFSAHTKTVNLSLLDEVSKTWKSSENITIKNELECLLFLQYAKEFLTQIKDDVTVAAATRGFRGNAYGDLSASMGKYNLNLYKFRKCSSDIMREYFVRQYADNLSVTRMNAVADSIFRRGGMSWYPVDAVVWEADANAAIQALRAVEDHTLEIIRERILDESGDVAAGLIKNIALAAIIVMVIAFIAVVTIKEVVTSVMKMKDATERIMNGEIDLSLNIESRDEMGQLADSFNRMMAVFQGYVRVADSIGRGDYVTEVALRSDNDILGKALNRMKNNLHSISRENEARTWLLAGNNAINDRLREERDIRSMAQDIIEQITTYLNAQVGAIYLLDNGMLHRVAGYALDVTGNVSFELGQSLVGQAALEKRSILFEKVPLEYLKISSGLGNGVPANIIVFPFLYIGKVKGVIEIGSAHKFSPLDMEFLQMVSNNIAIAFNSTQSRVKLKELLEETQRQAEELESQQEELRLFNEELLDKLESIERSEAELKVQQEELQESNADLEEKASLLANEKHVLEKAKMEIEAKAQELESVSKYKSEFLANMSHELRTPLNSILILAQLLMENRNNSLNEKELKYATVIYNSGSELLNLINDILDLSKVESGKMELDIEAVSFDMVMNDLTMMFSQVAKNKSIEFKTELTGLREKSLVTDKQRLEQILRNLLSNAFKFTPAGGTVTLSIHRPLVAPQNQKSGTSSEVVAFSVNDTGIGIQKNKQEMIFEAFRQVDGTDKRKYGGTGLGLSISRELTDLLGGKLEVESEEGKGSTFTLYLPMQYKGPALPSEASPSHDQIVENGGEDIVAAATPAQTEKPIAIEEVEEVNDDRASIGENSRTVLIIEDDREFARILLSFVNERNYKGIIAHQGNVGLSYARRYKPDAILLDMKLPVMDGAEVIYQLKNDPELRHIPVQIISGYGRKKEVMELGAFDFVKKPIKKEDLQRVFDRLESFSKRKYKRLLIVEDNQEENKAIRDLVGNGDVVCVPAYASDEAYEKLEQQEFDCVIVDIGLRDVSGFELLEKIKANEAMNSIPIIVYTVQDLSKEESKRLNSLANTVVLKTAYSHERLLDETTLFLHRVEANLPKEKQNIIRKLHRADSVLNGKTVLIADDDMRNIYSLTNVFEEEGLNCLIAENGKEAIDVLSRHPAVDIILMDVMMPEMDGYEATLAIRNSGKFPKMPIIALTAKAMKGDREKCLAAGMSDYITKPVDIRQLLSLMRVWLYRPRHM